MSQQLKEKLILIAAIVVALLLIIAAGITGYIAITDPSSRTGIGTAVASSPFFVIVAYYIYKVMK
jgi:hypothetical protein